MLQCLLSKYFQLESTLRASLIRISSNEKQFKSLPSSILSFIVLIVQTAHLDSLFVYYPIQSVLLSLQIKTKLFLIIQKQMYVLAVYIGINRTKHNLFQQFIQFQHYKSHLCPFNCYIIHKTINSFALSINKVFSLLIRSIRQLALLLIFPHILQ